MHRKATAAAVLVLAGAAAGQCTYYVPWVPDFDQKRIDFGSIPGLPGDGGMYCLPTSVLNWFAYFANRGIPQASGLNGPRNWQSNVNYDLVTGQLSLMGSLMGTSASEGTKGNAGAYGATFYSIALAQNKVSVSHFWAGNQDPISPLFMNMVHDLGGYVAVCYGRYTLDSTSHYTRTGGHCITVVGQVDACAPITSTLRVRDPASDGYNYTQSPFTTSDVTLTATAAFFRGDSSQSYDQDTRWRMSGGTSIKFLDGMYVFFPRVALTPVAAFPNIVQAHHAYTSQGSSVPPTQTVNLGAVGAIRGLVMHPSRGSYMAITAPVGGVSRFFEIDPVTLVPTERLQGSDFRFMDVNRFGEIYICDGSVLKLINPKVNPPVVVNQVTLPSVPRMMAYDDATDTLAIVTPSGGVPSQLGRYNRSLTAPGAGAFLPAGVNPTGNQFLAFSRTGNIFMCGDGAPTIYRMTQSGNTLTALAAVGLPAGDQPAGLNIDDDDHILFATGGVVKEYGMVPGVGYLPVASPAFAGFPAGARLCVPRSRTNHVVGVHDRPGYADILNPEVLPGTPDCYANCDFSTTQPVLNVQDFSCFINMYAAGKIEANCDGSTVAPVLNVGDFSCFLNAYAAGCP